MEFPCPQGFPGRFESRNVSRRNVSREIGRSCQANESNYSLALSNRYTFDLLAADWPANIRTHHVPLPLRGAWPSFQWQENQGEAFRDFFFSACRMRLHGSSVTLRCRSIYLSIYISLSLSLSLSISISLSLSLSLYLSLSLSLYIYIYIYMFTYIYIYMCINISLPRAPRSLRHSALARAAGRAREAPRRSPTIAGLSSCVAHGVHNVDCSY